MSDKKTVNKKQKTKIVKKVPRKRGSPRTRKCLMIETKDNRKFFTHERNYEQLIEFANTVGAEISVVKTREEALDLSPLAAAISDSNHTQDVEPKYDIIETKIKKIQKTRNKLLGNAQKIRAFVRGKFESGDVVSLAEIKKKFSSYRLSSACFCNHISKAKKELEMSGARVAKLGPGKYQKVK